MQVGLFGGSFNPPHLAHLIIAEAMREQFALEQILWMPGYRPPHKQEEPLASAAYRLHMVRLATAGNPGFAVSDLEVQREGISYTVDTVRALQEVHPDVDYALIIGGDSWRDFSSWYRPDEIIERVPVLVYARPDMDRPVVDPRLTSRVQVARAPLLDISSSAIRQRRREGRSIRYLVPDAVHDYIIEHGLYRG